MGLGLPRQKSLQFNQERKKELRSVRYKFDNREDREIVMLGPAGCGKTQLMNSLCDIKFSKKYEENETAKIGYKLFSTVKSNYRHLNPISFTVVVTPG